MKINDNFDALKIYGGDSYRLNDRLSIRQPTLNEIKLYGENRYFSMIHTLCAVGADLKWQLHDIGIDYTKISDFELFYSILSVKYTKDDTRILFGDSLDFSQMKMTFHKELQEDVMMQNFADGSYIQIDKYLYASIVGVLRQMHRLKRNDELPGNEMTRQILIDDARDEYEANKDRAVRSCLLPLISTMVNSEGFKRDDTTVFQMKIRAFMDSVARISKIKNAELLLQSGYSGFGVNLAKIDKDVLNYMGELD